MKPCHIPVTVANNGRTWAVGMGRVLFTPVVHGRLSRTVVLDRVLYVPGLKSNLFSPLATTKKPGVKASMDAKRIEFSHDGRPILTATVVGNVAYLDGFTVNNSEQTFVALTSKSRLHQRLGHIGRDRLERLIREDLADGLELVGNDNIHDICEHCMAGKQHREPFPRLSNNMCTEN